MSFIKETSAALLESFSQKIRAGELTTLSLTRWPESENPPGKQGWNLVIMEDVDERT